MMILLAEDDLGHALLVQRNLLRAGIANEVVHVTDGQQAVDFLRREGKFSDAIKELYAPNVESHEPAGAQAPSPTKGFEAVLNKTEEFGKGMEEVHLNKVSDPIVADNYFSVAMHMDVTMKGKGRMKMEEIALYHVADGKIVSDRFFYTPMPMSAQN